MKRPSSTAARKGTGSKTVQTTVEAPASTISTANFVFAMAQKLKDQPRVPVLLTEHELGLLVEAIYWLTEQEKYNGSIPLEILAMMLDEAQMNLLKASDTVSEVVNAS